MLYRYTYNILYICIGKISLYRVAYKIDKPRFLTVCVWLSFLQSKDSCIYMLYLQHITA